MKIWYAAIFISYFVCSISEVQHPQVRCETTKGPITIEVYPEWAPLGAERFLNLVADEFYTNIALFRCVKRFLTQFGISENPIKRHWHREEIPDDPNLHLGIKKNYVSFAGGGPNSRSTQIFIAFEDLDFLGNEPWETPFAKVIDGQSTLDKFYKGYGDIPPFGNGPDQQQIHIQGNAYIRKFFPKVDFINSCVLLDANPHLDQDSTEKAIRDPNRFIPEDDKDDENQATSNQQVQEEQQRVPPVVENQAAVHTKSSIIGSIEKHAHLREVIEIEHHVNEIIRKNDVVARRALFFLFAFLVGLGIYSKYAIQIPPDIGKRQ